MIPNEIYGIGISLGKELFDRSKAAVSAIVSTLSGRQNKYSERTEFTNETEIDELSAGTGLFHGSRRVATPNFILKQTEKCMCCQCSKRWQLAWLASIGFLIVFGIRCNFGAAKVRMTENFTDPWGKEHKMDFHWTPSVLGIIEGSFFYGYLITQVPGGFIAARFPATTLFGLAIGTTSMLNLLMPVACYTGYGSVVVIQVLQGLAQGVAFPSVHGMWRFWAPPLERTKLATTTFTGSYAGAVIGLPLSALMTSYISWGAAFYLYGACGTVWFLFWYFMTFEKPSIHPTISDAERLLIESKVGVTSSLPLKFTNVPWKCILTSKCVWAILVANFCRSWTFYLLLIHQLAYMEEVLHMEIHNSGFLAALPHVVMAVMVLVGGQLADYLRSHNILSTTTVRKLFNCGGFGLEGLFLIICAYVRNPRWAMTCLVLAVGFSGFAISGFNVNHLDIAPRYASILMGMSNGLGTFAGMICPMVTERLTKTYHESGWETVLLTAGLIHFTGITFYGVFASGEQQPWAEPHKDNDLLNEKNSAVGLSNPAGYGATERVEFAPIPEYTGENGMNDQERDDLRWSYYPENTGNMADWPYGNASLTNKNFYAGY